jgi:hypothetical protein
VVTNIGMVSRADVETLSRRSLFLVEIHQVMGGQPEKAESLDWNEFGNDVKT